MPTMSKKVHPDNEQRRLMTRTTEEEYAVWARAAEIEAKRLGLPINRLTIGVWSRMVLNQAARALGVQLPDGAPVENDDPEKHCAVV